MIQNGTMLQPVTTSCGYLPGTSLLQTLEKPNNMTLTQSYEEKRDLLIGQLYKRSNTSVASRAYTYDSLGRPVTRSTSKDGATVNDSFGYNSRSELNTATVNNEVYTYDYDNIGNRETAQEAAESATIYESNQLNQYTAIGDFEPTYDDAGNQTKVKTGTGIWSVVYNAENRPISFTNEATGIVVECVYDSMGRRATKKVTVNGSVTLHQRFLYRGYLQIACCDLTRSTHPCLWLITWDPSQPVATRPLAIQKDGTWYTYGWDLTKNICEVYGQHGYIRTNYSYSPYGDVTISGDVSQPIQWSSEVRDVELGLEYYNWRYYNTINGKWISRDILTPIADYFYIKNKVVAHFDVLGLALDVLFDAAMIAWDIGDITYGYITGNDEMVTNGWIDLGADTLAAVIPVAPAGSTRAARASEKATREAAEKAAKEAAEKAAKEAAEKAAKEAAEKAAKEAAQKKVDDAFEEMEKKAGKKRNKKHQKGCKPCIPPVGTLAFEKATLRKSGRHSRECPNHVKLWVVNQSPHPECACFWNFYLNLDDFTDAPSGSISLDKSPNGCPPKQSALPGGGPI